MFETAITPTLEELHLSKSNIKSSLFLLLLTVFVGCSSAASIETQSAGVPNISERFDLSELDAVATEAEIIRLLESGHVMYLRLESFNSIGVKSPSCSSPPDIIDGKECNDWPDRLVIESWRTADPSGRVGEFYGRYSDPNGNLLAIGLQDKWTDSETGEKWREGPFGGSGLVGLVESASTVIDRLVSSGLELVEGVYLGRPSVVVPRSLENEYQVANPLLFRETRWQEVEGGPRLKISEIKVVDFAMLPPDSLPPFAQASDR